MSNMNEVTKVLNLALRFGLKKTHIVLMQCNSSYPTPYDQVNLNVIRTFKKKFQVNVGYSDHTEDTIAPIAAVALGANFIEKHFTLNRSLKGPDHFFSLNPQQFKKMVIDIRRTEKLMGLKKKIVTKNEQENRILSRKSIVAKKNILKGEKLNSTNLTTKRPGDGISPFKWDTIIGKKAKKNYKINEKI